MKNIVLLGWVSAALGTLFAFAVIPMVIVGSFYHPNAPYAPYARAIAFGSLIFVLCSASLALRFTVKRKAGDRAKFAKELGFLLLATFALAVFVRVAIPPVPANFVQHAGQVGYQIPREFTKARSNQPGEKAAVRIDYCLNNWKGVYDDFLGDCRRSRITLSVRPITADFRAYYYLDRRLKVAREGDHIADRTELERKMKVVQGDGWTGYTTSTGKYAQSPRAHHIVLDHSDRIVLFGECVSGHPLCSIFSLTPRGVLSFEYEAGQQFQYDNWKQRQDRIFELLDSWQKAE